MDTLSNLLSGFAVALTGENLLVLAFGGLVGTIVGAFPGLSAPTAIALLLPLTFTLDPTSAVIMLAGIYYGSQFGNSITAVLIGIPGDSASVVTAIEGSALAKRGKAGHALTIAAFCSFFGSTISAILLMLTAPLLAILALKFGPPEYMAIIILSFAVLPAFATERRIKLLISLGLGLFIATIGIDDLTAKARFTFGSIDLLSGIGFVPAVIGLYGIADVFYLAGQRTGVTNRIEGISFSKFWPPMGDWVLLRMSALRASALGFILGALPGLGATIASFTTYALERSLAKDKSRFGYGDVRGLAAGESGNNAAAIGAMVPMLTLGIPGSGATAIILGGFLIWGLQPGPMLFDRNPEFVWGLIASMYLGSAFLLVVNIVLVPVLVTILRVPQAVLGTIIVVFCTVATYSVNLAVFDLWIMLAFGILGFGLRIAQIPVTPIVLALVLQPILERSLRQSMTMSDSGLMIFFERPIAAALLVVSLIVFAGPPLWSFLRRPGERPVEGGARE
jgi:putative tricarboxylic transport membrane protein